MATIPYEELSLVKSLKVLTIDPALLSVTISLKWVNLFQANISFLYPLYSFVSLLAWGTDFKKKKSCLKGRSNFPLGGNDKNLGKNFAEGEMRKYVSIQFFESQKHFEDTGTPWSFPNDNGIYSFMRKLNKHSAEI